MNQHDIPVIIIGGGGHASVLADLLISINKKILGFVAPDPGLIKNYPGVTYLGDDKSITRFLPSDVKLLNGIGSTSVKQNIFRHQLFLNFKSLGYSFETVVHPSAILASTVTLHEGVQIMAGVVLQPNVIVCQNSIINTRASIDHDCFIGENVHVAPGVVLSGSVHISQDCFVGVGSTFIQGVNIKSAQMIKAGATITQSDLVEESVGND